MRVKTITESLTVTAGATYNSPVFSLETAPWEDYALIQWDFTSGGNPQSVTVWGRPTSNSPWGSVHNNATNSELTKITTFCPEYYISVIANLTNPITDGKIYIGR